MKNWKNWAVFISFVVIASLAAKIYIPIWLDPDNDVIAWSAQAWSPDKSLLATAVSQPHGGMGDSTADVHVYLAHANHEKDRVEVLGFDNIHLPGADAKVQMVWLSPSHLEVTYGNDLDLFFQVVLCCGANISVRRVPG